jgi:hypothetical protein
VLISGSASAQFDTIYFDTGSQNIAALLMQGGDTQVANSHFNRFPHIAYTQAAIVTAPSSTARLTAIGNRMIDIGTGSGQFISIGTDNNHMILGNMGIGYTFGFPTGTTTGVYTLNR